MGAEIKRGFYWHRVQGGGRTQYILLNWTTEAVDVGLLFFKEWKLKPAGFLNLKTLNQGQDLIEMG